MNIKQITEQLRDALEAAGLLECDGKDAKRKANRIIQAFIEKATEELQRECDRYVAMNAKLTRAAAHASEPWTVNTILQICDNAGVMLPTDDEGKAIAEAHNATLQPAHANECNHAYMGKPRMCADMRSRAAHASFASTGKTAPLFKPAHASEK